MINFIKDAVSAVSGIKTFLFNTDYRNNFDLQNVEFPCCVLTPIMRTNYDLNNIIRDSAELQLSVVESAPYDYSGDDLYAINKRCSDLALQVIANLQVKSKLDKELTFEFILPSGDEFISGVMCNLQCTMKQGSCIGAPSYVEIVVQPIKREIITSNGKCTISPSSGFNAMRVVEVDVNVDIPTTEEKSITITSNGEVEILPTSADAMTKVTANVQVPPPPLEEKQITITENGTTAIEASEGFEGLNSVEVTTDVNTLQGLDFEGVFDQEEANGINQRYKDGIEYAKQIKAENPNPSGSWDSKFQRDLDLVFFPQMDLSNVKSMSLTFNQARHMLYFSCSKLGSVHLFDTFDGCSSLREVQISSPIKELSWTFNGCVSLVSVKFSDISSWNSAGGAFNGCESLKNAVLPRWRNANISFAYSSHLSSVSIHHIIQNAVDLADGATARILTLEATAKTNWQNSEYYQQDLAVLSIKGITIA